ncbi:Taurine catabolism dioxygenase TauD, TfdA family [Geosmithia morbida]|uniref:Taurine catabolism dioxygenase TauD, TfdA family n=1 Tax=Geosmithia morbida TaxID=1094350 RepID=A0A9P4YSF4_9HYPO|nr:Taurine catabolism dioxygenase TauD, TfdA family [Geosmithia morbida]KAF4122271.1 Taurine catabolism dioxygenase TauD, TfdA family [Geosmithia morbida]
MPHSTSSIEVVSFPSSERNGTLLGAEVRLNGVDLSNLSADDCSALRDGLYQHSVLVIRKAGVDNGTILTKLCRIFDNDATDSHSAGRTAVKEESNILSRNKAARLLEAPDVVVIGNGVHDGYRGMKELRLRHVSQAEFHADPLTPEEVQQGQTRFYRWHIDAPLYEHNPGKVTIISCRETPSHLPDQTLIFENGKKKTVAAGGTAFVSGARAFSLLTPEEKEWAMNTAVQYAPRAYNWIADCKATSDGLTIVSQGKETPFDYLEPWTWDKVHRYPLVLRNPGLPNRPHMIALGCCIYQLVTTDPKTGKETKIEDFVEARAKIHSLMKKAMSPEYVYVHRYEPDDLVIWHNRGVWHSVTGELGESKRLMWQAAQGSTESPVAARWDEVDVGGSSWL